MFTDQHANEDIVHETRLHWIGPIRRVTVPTMAALGLMVASPLLIGGQQLWPELLNLPLVILIISMPLLAILWGLWVYIDWLDDLVVLTNQRIILIERTIFVNEGRREIPLDRIQNVTAQMDGWLEAWFDFGQIRIEAAGVNSLNLLDIPQPLDFRKQVLDTRAQRQVQLQQRLASTVNDALRSELRTMMGRTATTAPSAGDGGPISTSITWHRHWWFLLRAVLPALGLMAFPLAVFFGLIRLSHYLGELTGELAQLLAAALVLIFLIGLGYLFWQIASWRDDIYVIDGERLRDIYRVPLRLHYTEKETVLANVQDVSYTIPSILAFMLDYGDVVIETAGQQKFTFDGVARPRLVHAEISRRLSESREAAAAAQQRATRSQVLGVLAVYHEVLHEEQPQQRHGSSSPLAP